MLDYRQLTTQPLVIPPSFRNHFSSAVDLPAREILLRWVDNVHPNFQLDDRLLDDIISNAEGDTEVIPDSSFAEPTLTNDAQRNFSAGVALVRNFVFR